MHRIASIGPGSCALWALSIRTKRRNAPYRRSASAGLSEASWRSGYAEDCKSLHPGSIPGEASTFDFRDAFPSSFDNPSSVNLLFTEAGEGDPVFP